jgi:predicted phage terminase large subunit-like protein
MSVMALQVSAAEAREEVGKVLLAQDDLAFFCEYMSEGWYQAYEMHHLIAFELEQVLRYLQTEGESGTQFLIILTPPQHGKSALTSQFFPAWALGKMPNLRITEVSYAEALAAKNSRITRNIVLSDRYQAVFGRLSPSDEQVMLSADSRSVSAWDLAAPNRGGMVAAGVGGAISGQPKGLHIWDDPIKDHREAQSQATRDDVWDFYKSAMRVRMKAGVLIMTHWHPDDPAGRLLKQMVSNPNADKWRVLDLPGLIEEGLFAQDRDEQRRKMAEGVYMSLKDPLNRSMGEVLCPAMLSKEEMLKIKTQDDYFFSALYQQRPYLKEGQRYKRTWFKTVKKLPEGVTIRYAVRFWDKASSPTGDFSAGVLEAYCSDENFYILDVARGQWSSYERDQKIRSCAEKDRERWGGLVKTWHQQDPGSAGLDSAQATSRVLKGFPVFYETVSGSKETRSEPLESGMQGGQVWLVEGAWNESFVNECCAFNNGKYDDQVDAAASAHNKLLEMIGRHRESRIL